MDNLVERYSTRIVGSLSCFDRVVLSGILPHVCYPGGMTEFLNNHGVLLKDYPRFAEPLRDEVRANMESIAAKESLEIKFVRYRSFRKEEHVHQIVEQRGSHPGLVAILSAMETCPSYEYRGSDRTGNHRLRGKDNKCLHYYVYFIHEMFGLCYLRVPTWAPFRLQFYFNGHNWLAWRMKQAGLTAQQVDNAFVTISDWDKAQKLSDTFYVPELHHELDRLAALYCPAARRFDETYHWSIMQCEYATDIVFKDQSALSPIYDGLVHTAIHAVHADDVATFLARNLHPAFNKEVGTDFHTRIEGTRIKHHMGPAGIKMYDKLGRVLRIETTVNDVSFFAHYRTVEHRDRTRETKWAPMKKSIYSLPALARVALASNRRYLDFVSHIADPTAGIERAEQISAPVTANDRSYRGFNLFCSDDLALFRVLLRGEYCISGLRNASLRQWLAGRTGAQVSRILKRLYLHGLIRKVGKTYKYYLTELGKDVALTALKLRELVVIPTLAHLSPEYGQAVAP